MSRYMLRLHDGPDTPPIVEPLDAEDDVEAKALAEMRLLLTRDYTHVHVYKNDQEIVVLKRSAPSST